MRYATLGACAFAFGVMGVVAPASAVTNLLTNGDFESTDASPSTSGLGGALNTLSAGQWGVYDSIPGWTTTFGQGIEIQTAGVSTISSSEMRPDSTKYVELDSDPSDGSNSTMSQTVAVTPGLTYEFSFWYSPRVDDASADTNKIEWDFTPPGGVGGSVSGPSVTIPTTEVGEWTRIVDYFTAATTQNSVTITMSAAGKEETLGGFVDDVSFGVIPLPAGVFLIAGAFGLAGAVRRFAA